MVIFKSKQFLLIPCIGFAVDEGYVNFVLSWGEYGIAFPLFEVEEEETNEQN